MMAYDYQRTLTIEGYRYTIKSDEVREHGRRIHGALTYCDEAFVIAVVAALNHECNHDKCQDESYDRADRGMGEPERDESHD